MTGEEIKATKLTKLVRRLFAIDATLTKETSQLVTEYNEIIEETLYLENRADFEK